MSRLTARSSWRSAAPLLFSPVLNPAPRPAGLDAAAWRYPALFAAVILALVLEPIPASAVGFIGVTVATMLGYVAPDPAASVRWGLGGFSDPTVWLIFG